MAVQILSGDWHRPGTDFAVFACSTTDHAFGPIMRDFEEAVGFLNWLLLDPRQYEPDELEDYLNKFRRLREAGQLDEDGKYVVKEEVTG